MKTRVLVGFALVCSVSAGPTTDGVLKGIGEVSSNISNISFVNPGELYVYDDNENLVKVDLKADDTETINVTKHDLPNRVFFYLYTNRNSKLRPQKLYLNDVKTLKNSAFDPKKETKFVTHGWMNSHLSAACTLVRKAFLKNSDCNVIVIDWSRISMKPYMWASNRVLMVAQYVSKMIDFLESQGMNLSMVTNVGHSLGAHVAGLASHYAKNRVNYVVGLDPAQPLFLTADAGSRVARGDAKFVEIIHTNAGLLGYLAAIGDADFFPNGGSVQPGCIIDPGGACSHARSFKLFAESINSPKGFVAKKCDVYLDFLLGKCKSNNSEDMGGAKPNPNIKGKYYLETNSSPPYAKAK